MRLNAVSRFTAALLLLSSSATAFILSRALPLSARSASACPFTPANMQEQFHAAVSPLTTPVSMQKDGGQMRPLKMLEAGSSVQVAWVGNSFVFFNKLPRMVASMLKHDGIELIQKHVLVAGQGLDGHSRDEKVWKLLASKEWNYVILQDQSSVPGGADEVKLGESIAALASFFALRLPPADRGKVILYSTWGHKTGSPLLLHFKEAYPNFEEMNTKVTDGYRRYKHALLHARPSLDVGIAAVGTAFHSVYLAEVEQGRDPDDPHSLFSRLFAPDNFHPSQLGSYLAACVLYHQISGRSPSSLSLSDATWAEEALSPAMMQTLQDFAHAAVVKKESS